MQYENISVDLLLASNWPKVTLPVREFSHGDSGVHAELNQYQSRGRYNYLYLTEVGDDRTDSLMHIWFELEQDALYFALKFAS